MRKFRITTIPLIALLLSSLTLPLVAAADQSEDTQSATEGPSRAQQLMGDIAPQLADFTDDVLYGQVWSRPELSPRDRSLVTISALIAMDRPNQLRSHIRLARQNGVSEAEISETITHLAFYSGWPTAVNAVAIAREVFAETSTDAPTQGDPSSIIVSRFDDQASAAAPSEYFTGSARVEGRFKGTGEARIGGARVIFSKGARTNWHSHPLGQTLFVTEGIGLVQAWGEPVQEIRPGDTVWIPAGIKHWHGASAEAGMTHIAASESKDGSSVVWMEPVTDEQYGQ